MRKFNAVFVILLFAFFLMGCQNQNLNLRDEVTSIQVYEWDGDEVIETIDDKDFIEELVKDLKNAKTHSTASIDWALPEYKLFFLSGNEVLYEIGYCEEIQNFGDGAVGRYWEFDQLYEVSTELPIQLN